MLAPKNEAALNQVWHNKDALCIAQNFLRNAFVRSRHYGVKNVDR
jgi:hypothetical protein